jgi:DNA-binding MarR family transcriptional regulator
MQKKNSAPKLAAFARQEAAVAGECTWSNLEAARDTLALEDFLSFRLTRLAGAVQRNLTRYYAENYDLSVPEWRILGALVRFSPINFGELLRISSYDKALISRTIATMKTKSLVETRTDPTNKKKVIVEVTPRGQATYRKILPEARARQVDLLSALDAEERTVLFRALQKLQARLVSEDPS